MDWCLPAVAFTGMWSFLTATGVAFGALWFVIKKEQKSTPLRDDLKTSKILGRSLTGGCLCGVVRYRINRQHPITPDSKQSVSPTCVDAVYCHCRMCQRSTSSPLVPWLTVPTAAFEYTNSSNVQTYRSSKAAVREFCRVCGSQIVFRYSPVEGSGEGESPTVDIALISLDDEPTTNGQAPISPQAQSSITPSYHIWTMSAVSWCTVTDSLPRYHDRGV